MSEVTENADETIDDIAPAVKVEDTPGPLPSGAVRDVATVLDDLVSKVDSIATMLSETVKDTVGETAPDERPGRDPWFARRFG